MVAMATPLIKPTATLPLVDKDGKLSSTGLQLLQGLSVVVNGLTPLIPCTSVHTTPGSAYDLYTLTPFNISSNFPGYVDYYSFGFVADASASIGGTIRATVVPETGTADTLNVYKANGLTPATVGDIVINLFYIVYYVSALNSGSGGFVIK